MSVDELSADGARTQACVSQQEASLLLLTVSLHISNMLAITLVNAATYFQHFFFFSSPGHFHTIRKKKEKKSAGKVSIQIHILNFG